MLFFSRYFGFVLLSGQLLMTNPCFATPLHAEIELGPDSTSTARTTAYENRTQSDISPRTTRASINTARVPHATCFFISQMLSLIVAMDIKDYVTTGAITSPFLFWGLGLSLATLEVVRGITMSMSLEERLSLPSVRNLFYNGFTRPANWCTYLQRVLLLTAPLLHQAIHNTPYSTPRTAEVGTMTLFVALSCLTAAEFLSVQTMRQRG